MIVKPSQIQWPLMALLLSISSVAHAQATPSSDGLAPQEGLSVADLNKVVRNFEIIRDESNPTSVRFAGTLPRRCAENVEMTQPRFEGGRHLVTIRMPNCERDFRALPEDNANLVSLSSVLSPITLEDKSGKMELRSFRAGDPASPSRQVTEELKDAAGRIVEVTGSEARAAEAGRLAAEAADRQRRDEFNRLERRVTQLCRSGDFQGAGRELESSLDLLGDVSDLLQKLQVAESAKLRRALDNATTADEARTAYEALRANAERMDQSVDELEKAYIEKRMDILKELANEATDKSAQLAASSAADEWAAEFRSLSRREFNRRKTEIAEIHDGLATKLANANDHASAVRVWDRAKKLTNADGMNKIDRNVAEMYARAFRECAKKNPMRTDRCEREFVGKSKEAAERIRDRLANKRGDDAEEELANFNAEFVQTFGAGATFQMRPFGNMSQFPGAVEQFKQQNFQEFQQRQLMEQQMRMRQMMLGPQGMMGGMMQQPGMMQMQQPGMMGGAIPSSGFFR
jgi:hypothetical protein